VTSGGTPSRENKSYWGGNIPWITTSLIDFNEIVNAIEFITNEGLKNSSTKLFSSGTLLMALYGQGITRGKTAILKIEAATNQACAAIILNEKKANRHFVFQYLINKYEDIRKLSNTGNQENLNGELVKSIKINLPPLPEQTAIAQLLSTWDNAITKTQALLAQKELRKKWLMQNLLTGKMRLKINDELGIKNDELKEVRFGDFCKIKKGSAISFSGVTEGEYPVIAGGKTSPYSHNSFTHENVITISASGAYAGFVAYHKNKIWASDCSVVEEKKGVSNINYLYYLLLLKQQLIYSLQAGGAQPHVFPKDIHNLSLIIHNSLKEQTAISQVLQAADKEIQLLKMKCDKLKEQKKGLMQVLLTGKKRLNQDLQDLKIYRINAVEHNLESPKNSESPNPNNNLEIPKI